MMRTHDDDFRPLEPELGALADRLDALAAGERASAPPELESRLQAAVDEALAPRPIPIHGALRRWLPAAGVAAAVALAGGAALLWSPRPAVRQQPDVRVTAADLRDDAELLTELNVMLDESLGAVSLDASLREEGESVWSTIELLGDALAGEEAI